MAVILCATMEEPLRSTLVEKFCLALPGHLKPTNSKDDETATSTKCETVHFDWYNRFSTDVQSLLFQLYADIDTDNILGI
jgi:hypothetical protein